MSTKEKMCFDMDFDEFVEWAIRYSGNAVIRGGFEELRSAMFVIINQAAQNKVWGGERKK